MWKFCLLSYAILEMLREMTRNLRTHRARSSKFCCHTYIVIIPHNFKILLPFLYLPPQKFKILQTLHLYFLWIGNLTKFFFFFLLFFEIGTIYEWIIITIVSNIAVLLSQNVIFFGYLTPNIHGVNKKTSPGASLNLLPLITGFHRICLLFYKK